MINTHLFITPAKKGTKQMGKKITKIGEIGNVTLIRQTCNI